MEPLMRNLLAALGLGSIAIALAHIVLGPAAIPGGMAVNATMDNQDRFFAALFLGYGVAVLWCLRDWRARLAEIRLLLAILFVGGLARLLSVALVGMPHPFHVAMMLAELSLPVAILSLTLRRPGDGAGG